MAGDPRVDTRTHRGGGAVKSTKGLGWLAAFAGLVPGSLTAQDERPLTLTFGVYSFKRPTDVYRDFRIAVDGISQSMTVLMQRSIVVELRVFKTYEECLDKFVGGEVDFVRFGPASYVLAKQRNPDIQLLAAEREDGDKPGLIVVRKDSPVQTLADLKGRSFAFGDEHSTIGRYLSQAELAKAGVHAGDLKRYAYLDRHDKVFTAVEIGDYDAGALHAATFRELNKDGKLRAIACFDNVGKAWIARRGLDVSLATALAQALLTMQTKEVLTALKATGFQPATDAGFDFVREGMKRAKDFGAPPAPAKNRRCMHRCRSTQIPGVDRDCSTPR